MLRDVSMKYRFLRSTVAVFGTYALLTFVWHVVLGNP